jgi:hypothetical protein
MFESEINEIVSWKSCIMLLVLLILSDFKARQGIVSVQIKHSGCRERK